MASVREPHLAAELFEGFPAPEPLPRLFYARADSAPERPVSYVKIDGRWQGISWRASRQAVEEMALGLLELGAGRGTPIAILSQTRREWSQFDMAILSIGAITVGLYPSLTGGQVRQLLELSGARIVLVDERHQQSKLLEAAEGLSPPLTVVTMESRTDDGRVITLDELRRRGSKRRRERPEELSRRVQEIKSSDVASYVYTSGTTGEPKGAMLTHSNFHYVIHATNALIPYSGERALVFLPLAHSLQRYASYLGLLVDVEAFYAESIEKVQENLVEVRPTIFALVPRVLEKIHAKILAKGAESPPVAREVFARSLAVLSELGALRRSGGVPGLSQRARAALADRIVGARVREGLGGRVKFIGSGGAALASEVHAFFEDVRVPILEGYGLTETCAPVCINTLTTRRLGTVGRPLPGTEVTIAPDGEILVKGPGVFSSYYRDDAATREAFDEYGWFRTGDLGEMSRDGFLTITDRKKELIVTSGGKNVAPQPIESALKRHPWVGQAVVVGDRRPYLGALITLDPEAVEALRVSHGSSADPAALASLPAVQGELEQHLARVNAGRAPHEQIRRFRVLSEELSIERGELTPTLKVKRRVIDQRHRGEIDRLYL